MVRVNDFPKFKISGSVGWPRFICLGINFSGHLDQQINDP